jgi:Glycosyl transferases group 1
MVDARFKSKSIWVDATNLVRRGLQGPIGVTRVENGLLSLALADPDGGIAIMDRRLNRIEPASDRTRNYVKFLIERHSLPLAKTYIARLVDELFFIDVQLKYGDNTTARRWALTLANGAQKKMLYQISKVLFIIMFLTATFLRILPSLVVNLCRDFWPRQTQKITVLPKFIISHELYSSLGLRQAIKRRGLAPVHIIYDLIPIHFPNFVSKRHSRRISILFGSILKYNEISIAISNTVRDEFSAWNDEAVKAIYTLPFHACPLNAPTNANAQGQPVHQLAGKPFAMFVSSIDVRKCHYLLVDVWAEMAKRLPANALPDLVLIGRKGHGWPKVQAALDAAPHIASKVHTFHDMDDQSLLWCYNNTKLGLFPSITEGWGLAISEFLAHGVPVVHSDVPILHEAAQGLMPSAPIENAVAWADVIEPLLTDPSELQKLKKRIAEEYDRGTPDGFANCVFAYLKMLNLREQNSFSSLTSPPTPRP